jgi:hypothetical protein
MGGVNGEHLLILSRKGFDSGFGGRPSPVLPGGRMVSLPIPEDPSPVTFGDCLVDQGMSVADLLKRLGVSHVRLERGGRKERLRATPELGAHLDPDLRVGGRLSRPPEWRPHFAGRCRTFSSGCSVSFIGAPGWPFGLPGLRPDLPRSDFGVGLAGPSDDSGLLELRESPFTWAARSVTYGVPLVQQLPQPRVRSSKVAITAVATPGISGTGERCHGSARPANRQASKRPDSARERRW